MRCCSSMTCRTSWACAGGCALQVRGIDFRSGYHDYKIRRGWRSTRRLGRPSTGTVCPGACKAGWREWIVLGGGLERGTSTLIQGAPEPEIDIRGLSARGRPNVASTPLCSFSREHPHVVQSDGRAEHPVEKQVIPATLL